MNILLTTGLLVRSAPLVSAEVADRVLKSYDSPSGGSARRKKIAGSAHRKPAAKRSSAVIGP
jgi:hypothetical protein